MSSDEHKNKGNEEFRNKNYTAAIEHFTAGISVDPTNHVLYSNRSACYASLLNWDSALSDAEKCVGLMPSWSKGYTRLGAAHHGKNNLSQALESYKKGLDVDPTNETLQASVAELEEAIQSNTNNNNNRHTNPFATMFGPNTFTKIQQSAKLAPYLSDPTYVQMINMIISNPNLVQQYMQDARIQATVIELLGLSSFSPAQESPPAAASSSSSASSQKTTNNNNNNNNNNKETEGGKSEATLIKERGNAHYKKREFVDALKCYEEAIALEPSTASFYLNKSSVLYEMGEMEQCLKLVEETLEKIANKTITADYISLAKFMTRRAQSLQAMKNFDDAIAQYKKALLEHRNANTLNLLSACEAEKKKTLQEAYLNPELSVEAKERGNTHFREQKYPEAVAEYSEAIKRNPNDHVLYSNRAAAYMKLGAYDDALKDCELCLSIDGQYMKAIVRMAHCYFFRKEYHKAIQKYDQGLKIDPQHAECLDGVMRTRAKIAEGMNSGEVDDERIARAKNDPEVREILSDTYMQFVLRELSMDPSRAEEYLSDPNIAQKIQKLVAAGILSFGGPSGNKKK